LVCTVSLLIATASSAAARPRRSLRHPHVVFFCRLANGFTYASIIAGERLMDAQIVSNIRIRSISLI
jgi:hypothetical protein